MGTMIGEREDIKGESGMQKEMNRHGLEAPDNVSFLGLNSYFN